MGDYREFPGAASSPSTSTSPSASSSPSPSPSPSPNPDAIVPGRWAKAERATREIICKVQPTVVSDERRRHVIDYVQRLFSNFLSCEVFPYGSVPLKTYLPDGDIDLTALGGANAEEALANSMVSILEGEDQSRAAEFAVKDIQLIRAEVKLVKCIVQNIVVDISFNQIGGLCTLCFLEQVDSLIGREHLFKRSIILIKAWCYYESRILGAHHGLISTYALETLVLYIFHLFHATLNGPLQVLYKFLDYFSKFDWENYCVSLAGPVRLCSLPVLVAEIPDYGGSDLLLSNEFLRYCTDMFSVPSRGADSGLRTYQPKHLNIIDPLKENNNLGRSVSKGNFFRIRSAFTYGARKLGRILLQPGDDVADGLCKFFFNTLDRHGNGQRPDVQIDCPSRACGSYSPVPSVSETSLTALEMVNLESKLDANSLSHERINDPVALAPETKCNGKIEVEGNRDVSLSVLSLESAHDEKKNALVHRDCGDAHDLASCRVEDLKIPNDSPRQSELSGLNTVSPAGTLNHAPHLYSSDSMLSNGEKNNGNEDQISLLKFSKDDHPGVACDCNGNVYGCGLDGNLTACDENAVHGASPLSDLSGDHENQLSSLQRGKWCYEYAFNMQALPRHPSTPPSVFHANNLRDVSHKMGNGVFPNPAFYVVNPAMIPTMSFSLEDMPKPRGTGTYFPNMVSSFYSDLKNHHPLVHRPSIVKGRNHAMMRSPRHLGRNPLFMETTIVEQTSPEISYTPVLGNHSDINNVPSNVHHPLTSQEKGHHPDTNGVILQSDGFEYGSVEDLPSETNQPCGGSHRHQQRFPSSRDDMSPVSPAKAPRMLKPVISRDQDRVSVESSYHLKDEDDFPPLSI